MSSARFLGLFFLSWLIVSLGQPAWVPFLGPITALVGVAIPFRLLLDQKLGSRRFLIGSGWFFLVQLFQLSWALTHPYLYIYLLWTSVSLLFGFQFGLLSVFVTKERLQNFGGPIFLASLWTFLEWSRLFILSGLSWNPLGLSLSTYLVPMQAVSILGIYGLSFLVVLTNLYAVRCLLSWEGEKKNLANFVPFLVSALFPYLFGIIHLSVHLPQIEKDYEEGRLVDVLLVQPASPVEEIIKLKDPQSALLYSHEKMKHILGIISKHLGKPADLIVLPEYVVPFHAYAPIFPYESVKREFKAFFGDEGVQALPPLSAHFSVEADTHMGTITMVNHAFWIQAVANLFNAEVIAGLEDSDPETNGTTRRYVSALVFFPNGKAIERYEKRVLVPLGEYIPFEFVRSYARSYGVLSSFTPGDRAKVISGRCSLYGLSICYEETYGNVMRDNRVLGAEMLVNLTNDFWYPYSRLPQQHFDHARLRAVEMGIPLVRSANTGITAAVDSLGSVVGILGGDQDRESLAGALYVSVPRYHYSTLYTYLGDNPLILFCLASIFLFLLSSPGANPKRPHI